MAAALDMAGMGHLRLTVSSIECTNLRSADMFSKNDVYVEIACGPKTVKTRTIPNGGRNVTFPEAYELIVSEAELASGVVLTAMDKDKYTRDDLLGVATLERSALADDPARLRAALIFKGAARRRDGARVRRRRPVT